MIEEKTSYTDEEIKTLIKDRDIWKHVAEARKDALDNIRAVIKQHYPDVFGKSHLKPATSEVLNLIFSQAKVVENGRNVFRDELMKVYGYDHHQLVELLKKQLEGEND